MLIKNLTSQAERNNFDELKSYYRYKIDLQNYLKTIEARLHYWKNN